jgi:hypothetical protein
MLSSGVRLVFPSGLFPSGSQTKILHAFLISPIRARCPVLLALLDVMTLVIFGEKYEL